jgi:LysM repeat protein
MNNPNPFVPKGSLLEQQSKRRSRLKLGVFCILAVGIASLSAMLIQGCKREQDQTADNSGQPPVDTNNYVAPDTNAPTTSMEASNAPVPPGTATAPAPLPPVPNAAPAPLPAPAPAPTESDYVIVKGDTLAKIAKANGVTVKAIEEANPNVQPTRLRVGQKLVLPAGGPSTTGSTAAAETASGVASTTGGDETYTVKSGDTLTRIARRYGVTVKAIEAENNLTTTQIKVGKKLNIPAKAEAAPAPVNAPPAETTAPPAPQPEPVPAPSSPAPAPASPAPGQ